MILMLLVFLYNCDGIEKQLKHPQRVKELHEHYCKLLHKYIKSIHNPQVANVLFGKGLMLIHETQRAYQLSLQRLQLWVTKSFLSFLFQAHGLQSLLKTKSLEFQSLWSHWDLWFMSWIFHASYAKWLVQNFWKTRQEMCYQCSWSDQLQKV